MIDLPASVDDLRNRILQGNAAQFGADANVHTRIAVDDHVRRERWLKEIEAAWGRQPGRQLSDGRSIFVLGAQFGNALVAVQPGMGYEGDPMKLLFERGHAPTHAFSAFYRYLREDFGAHAVLHFGTHGSLEFMPGKQTGLSGACWPERLIGDLPNLYLYASNNPSEGTIAKRRAGATLISYLTPPVARAGLLPRPDGPRARRSIAGARSNHKRRPRKLDLGALIQLQAAGLELATAEPQWSGDRDEQVQRVRRGRARARGHADPARHARRRSRTDCRRTRTELLQAIAESTSAAVQDVPRSKRSSRARHPKTSLVGHGTQEQVAALRELGHTDRLLVQDSELDGILRALDGRYVRPAPGGDLLRTPQVLPTGRNVHGFDPFRIPSAYAVRDGARLAQLLLDRQPGRRPPPAQSVASGCGARTT